IDVTSQISFFIVLSRPELGGELRLYASTWQPDVDAFSGVNRASPEADALASLDGFFDHDPEVGDLMLFDGGRYYHRVNEIGGTRPRWTYAGFVARASDRQGIRFWF